MALRMLVIQHLRKIYHSLNLIDIIGCLFRWKTRRCYHDKSLQITTAKGAQTSLPLRMCSLSFWLPQPVKVWEISSTTLKRNRALNSCSRHACKTVNSNVVYCFLLTMSLDKRVRCCRHSSWLRYWIIESPYASWCCFGTFPLAMKF